jgi:uncharacterized membrane protein YtjA (UPF0391 family)
MGNLDFSNSPGFSWYCVLLLISGIAMLGMTGVPGASTGSRVANLLFGLGFALYALYLIFVFEGGHYMMFFKAFILPVLLIVGTIKSITEKRRAAGQPAQMRPTVDYGMAAQPQPNGYAPANPYGQAQQPADPYGQPNGYAPQNPYGQPQAQPVNGGYAPTGYPQQPMSSADAPTQAVPAPQWGQPQPPVPPQQASHS